MASLANISSLDVAYYTGRVKIFPFQNHFLLDKSFSTFTLTTGVFVIALQASSPCWQSRCCSATRSVGHPQRGREGLQGLLTSHSACQGEGKGNEEDWGEDWGGGGDLRLEHVSPVDNWKIERYDKLWTNRKVMIAPGTGVVTSSHCGALPFHRFPSIHASGSGLQMDLFYTFFCCCKKQC